MNKKNIFEEMALGMFKGIAIGLIIVALYHIIMILTH